MSDGFDDNFPLRRKRVHEVFGPGSFSFASICCGLGTGKAVWISKSDQNEMLNPVALALYCDPSDVLTISAKKHAELLALSEESLRSGAVATVVVEIDQPVSLKAGRRLQLAAETGGTTGIVLMPHEELGNNAAETRWQCLPVYDEKDSTLQNWSIKKNKSGIFRSWKVRWDDEARRVIVVSKAGERTDFARARAKPAG